MKYDAIPTGGVLPCCGVDVSKAKPPIYCNCKAIDVSSRLKWSYGVTTLADRFDDLLPKTLTSLNRSGFGQPRIFVDGEGALPDCVAGLPITQRIPKVMTMANWWLALTELYMREPLADRYAIFQDDLVCSRNLRAYLEASEYPEKGYLNLYTFPENEKPTNGWHESNQRGRGAVALVFNNEAVRSLLLAEHMIKKVQDRQLRRGYPRGTKGVDGGVVESFRKIGWKEYVHSPSLVQHTGLVSSMGNRRHPLATSFKGESFDLINLLRHAKAEPRGLGDRIEAALSMVGITSDRVEAWVGAPCGCNERKEKLNQLGFWAKRVLLGKTDRAVDKLEELLEQPNP